MDSLLIRLTEDLKAEIDRRVQAGEFETAGELLAEALRYYFDRHPREAWEEYVRREVAWSRQHGGT